ncbi:MAG: bifunctional phosphopantothenoylcysteine decarboxylase/phosphopantothenate--cysteine ligase CoaBC [Balneolales bacterium]
MLSGKRIILGVTGGIAAYKSVYLLRALQQAGAEVRVTLTPSAMRFVGMDTFSALSRHEVAVELFPRDSSQASSDWVRHIQWGEWADLLIIAPCTANTLAKLVNGFSDSMLTAIALSVRCPILICPAMDGGMYQAQVTRRNLEQAVKLGFRILEPEKGYLASGLDDVGRLPEPDKILATAGKVLGQSAPKPLSGIKVVVTAGPTREFIDPVRFLSNPSSGKMGFAMAGAARDLGAEVMLLHGQVPLPELRGIATRAFVTADDLFQLVQQYQDSDVIIMAAAVSDFRPRETHSGKIKKGKVSSTLTLTPTPDILQWLGERRMDGQVLMGFAMETDHIRENALLKLKNKKIDWIIANSVSESGSGFMGDTNSVLLLSPSHESNISGPKKVIARQILETIFPTADFH